MAAAWRSEYPLMSNTKIEPRQMAADEIEHTYEANEVNDSGCRTAPNRQHATYAYVETFDSLSPPAGKRY
jgi:hypothetical protein